MKTSIGYTFGNNLANDIKVRTPEVHFLLEYGGMNSDITAAYFWFTQFRNYVNKKYEFIKIEDTHHFSEASQFGANIRQIKGGGIRAFQENLNQVIQLIKVHLMPLLKEIKQAHMYKIWFDKILENDEYLYQELSKPKGQQKERDIITFRNERNEAINHLKNKWVSEVDGSKLWTISRSTQEQGLDMTLLPQLFFGTYLDDPFQRKKTLKEQLDESTYKVDITTDAKTQVANFQYRFYTWLPTAVQDTLTTFNIKLASLRQFYTQIEMHMQFMKPLLMEISKKTEKMSSNSFFRGFGDEDPAMVKLFDTTLTFTRVFAPRFVIQKYSLQQFEFTKFGLLVPKNALTKDCGINQNVVVFKVEKGKIHHEACNNEKEGIKNYHVKLFSGDQSDLEKLSKAKFNELEERVLPYYFFAPVGTPEITFTQRRRQEIVQTQQGPQQAPYMINSVAIQGSVLNFVEIAAKRQHVRSEDLHLLESFIQELGAVKDELLAYLNYQEGDDLDHFGIDFSRFTKAKEKKENDEKKSTEEDSTIPSLSFFAKLTNLLYASGTVSPQSPKSKKYSEVQKKYKQEYIDVEVALVEEVYKSYNIYKKVGGFIGW